MYCASSRPITSVGPPAANGTTMVIGRDGKSSAKAKLQLNVKASAMEESFFISPPHPPSLQGA